MHSRKFLKDAEASSSAEDPQARRLTYSYVVLYSLLKLAYENNSEAPALVYELSLQCIMISVCTYNQLSISSFSCLLANARTRLCRQT